MAEGPLVSFFVLGYNQERYVRAAVEGAFAQTYRPLEILLSDDCSPDGTYEVMREMATAYRGPHRVILNRNPQNLGLIGHINRVMDLTSGAFVVQNAGDDISVPERTARLAAAWVAGGGRVKAVHSRLRRIDGAGRTWDFPRAKVALAGQRPVEVIGGSLDLIGASMGWSREIFEVFGPLPANVLAEDTPIGFRASLIGETGYVDEPLVLYRTGGDSDPATAGVSPGHAALYGHYLKLKRWDRSYLWCYLRDMERVRPPDYATCRRLCTEGLAQLEFEIRLAEAGYAGRLARLPQALRLAIALRAPSILTATLKYLFDRPYIWYFNQRYARRPG